MIFYDYVLTCSSMFSFFCQRFVGQRCWNRHRLPTARARPRLHSPVLRPCALPGGENTALSASCTPPRTPGRGVGESGASHGNFGRVFWKRCGRKLRLFRDKKHVEKSWNMWKNGELMVCSEGFEEISKMETHKRLMFGMSYFDGPSHICQPTHPNPSVLFWNQTHFIWISQSSHLHGLLLEGNNPIQ